MTPIKNIPPIDLTPYEDALIEMPGLDKSSGFGAWIRVETPGRDGKSTYQNLWETANPNRRPWEDGFLSFEEAKGKTFYVPFYFCNNMGHWVLEVKSREDFLSLQKALWEPLRNEEIGFNSCLTQGIKGSGTQDPPRNESEAKDLGPALLSSLDSLAENFKNSLSGALAAGLDSAALVTQVPGAFFRAGIFNFLQGVGEEGWDSSEALEQEEDSEIFWDEDDSLDEPEDSEWFDEDEEI